MVNSRLYLRKRIGKMEVSSVNGRIKLLSLVGTLISAAIFGFSGYQMLNLPLWGWRPLLFEIGAWGLILFPLIRIYTRHDQHLWMLKMATVSGLLFAAAFPVSPLTFLIFFAWIPLFMIEEKVATTAQKPRPWMVWKYAFHAFVLWNVITTFWVVNTHFAAGLIANFLNGILMATVFALAHVTKFHIAKQWRRFVLPAYWITFEFIHMFWDISWPWLSLGNVFAQYPIVVQWYEFTGIFGGAIWIFILNELIYQLMRERKKANHIERSSIIRLAIVLLVPIGISLLLFFRSANYESETPAVEVAIVQPNFEPHYQKFEIPDQDQLDRFMSLSDSILTQSTDYLVFPETSFPLIMLNDLNRSQAIRAMQELIDRYPNLKIVTGASTYRVFEPNDELPETVRETRDGMFYDIQNSALEIEAGGDIEVYFKSKLVPGAEFFPFKSFLPFIKPIVQQLGGSMGHAMQDERSVFISSSGKVAPVICYESIYGAYVGEYVQLGANLIFIITNDGWWDDTPGHRQHLAFARLRAIEHRRPIARSANTGTSAFITSEGRVELPTNYEETTAIISKITPREDMTFYARWGDYLARIAAVVSILMLVFTIASIWRRRVEVRKDNPQK